MFVKGSVLFILCTASLTCLIKNHSIRHELFADDAQLNTQLTRNSLKITQTWAVHFKIVSKTVCYGWKKTNPRRITIRLKPFASQHHLLSTRSTMSLSNTDAKNVKFSFTEGLSWISHVWSSGRLIFYIFLNRPNETLQSTHRNTTGRPVHDHLWWVKWLTYQPVFPIPAILLMTRCSSTLSKSCLTGSNWYGCILVGLSGKVSVSSVFGAQVGHFAATLQSDVVGIWSHDLGVMATLSIRQKMPFFMHL